LHSVCAWVRYSKHAVVGGSQVHWNCSWVIIVAVMVFLMWRPCIRTMLILFVIWSNLVLLFIILVFILRLKYLWISIRPGVSWLVNSCYNLIAIGLLLLLLHFLLLLHLHLRGGWIVNLIWIKVTHTRVMWNYNASTWMLGLIRNWPRMIVLNTVGLEDWPIGSQVLAGCSSWVLLIVKTETVIIINDHIIIVRIGSIGHGRVWWLIAACSLYLPIKMVICNCLYLWSQVWIGVFKLFVVEGSIGAAKDLLTSLSNSRVRQL